MDIYNELKERGLIHQTSNEQEIRKYLSLKNAPFYAGFDPSGPSLHIGNFLTVIFAKRLENAGLKPIILVGGATGMIGDPSGKTQERILQDKKIIQANVSSIKKQLLKFYNPKTVKFVNNLDWTKKLSVIDYLHDIGKHFNINEMLGKESVATRLQTGISYTEFSYMILQSYDFLTLFKKYKARLQVGGSDQWGNITAGIDFIRKLTGQEGLGLTMPLMLKSDGAKFGKSENGAVWLDAKTTSPYHFYQFWINANDQDISKLLNYFSLKPLEEIKKIEETQKQNPEKREAQKSLAKEMTELAHGKQAAERAEKISNLLFYGKIKELNESELKEAFGNLMGEKLENFKEMNIAEFLTLTEISSSKRQAREDIENGAIELNGEKIKDLNYTISSKNFLFKKYIIVKRGKRDYFATTVK